MRERACHVGGLQGGQCGQTRGWEGHQCPDPREPCKPAYHGNVACRGSAQSEVSSFLLFWPGLIGRGRAGAEREGRRLLQWSAGECSRGLGKVEVRQAEERENGCLGCD